MPLIVLSQTGAVVIGPSGTLPALDKVVERYSALRFLISETGAGVFELRVIWRDLVGGTDFQSAPEIIALVNDYAEIPVRSQRAFVEIAETGGVSSITIIGTVSGVLED